MFEIISRGLFKLDPKKNYVLIDKNRNEHSTLEIHENYVDVVTKSIKQGEEDKIETFENAQDLEQYIKDNDYTITSDSIRWIEYNPNPSTNKANDCSIRAYCAAENLKWDESYKIACQYGERDNFMPNDSSTCKHILEEEFGYTYFKLKKEEKGITVKEFAVNHSSGTFVLDCARHLVTVIDGEYYDSWDSGEKKIKGYYKK